MRRLELTVPNPGGMGVNQLKLSGLKSARAMDFHTFESRLWFAYLRNPNQSGSQASDAQMIVFSYFSGLTNLGILCVSGQNLMRKLIKFLRSVCF